MVLLVSAASESHNTVVYLLIISVKEYVMIIILQTGREGIQSSNPQSPQYIMHMSTNGYISYIYNLLSYSVPLFSWKEENTR